MVTMIVSENERDFLSVVRKASDETLMNMMDIIFDAKEKYKFYDSHGDATEIGELADVFRNELLTGIHIAKGHGMH